MNRIPSHLSRRELMAAAAIATGTSLLSGKEQTAAESESPGFRVPDAIVDTNVSLFHFPFRRLPLDSTEQLVEKLRTLQVTYAWAGSFEGVLHRDIAAVNKRLDDECSKFPELIPIGTVNPSLPGWEEDLRRCHFEHRFRGVRIYPGYHQYHLDDPSCSKMFAMAGELGCFVQIVTALEDTRTQHELVQVADVDLTPLLKIMRMPKPPKIQLLNLRLNAAIFKQITEFEDVYFDTSRIDGTDGLDSLTDVIPADRICYGSHSPFLIPEASLIRVVESPLSREERSHILFSASQKLAAGESS